MKRRAVWCLMLLLILSGCRMEAEPSPAPPPTDTPTMVAATPQPVYLPISSPIPTPEPTPGIAERLQAAEELYLRAGYEYEGMNLVQSPDFVANTGYSKLKTPPEGVVDYTRSYAEEICVETFRQENDGGERKTSILLCGPDLLQEFSLALEINEGSFGSAELMDANFDGYPDLTIYIGGRRGGIRYYALFLWDSESESYYYEPSFSHITTPKIDFEHQVIWGGSDFTFGYYYHAFELIQGVYTETHQLVGEHGDVSWDNTKCVEYSLENGEMTEVGEEIFPDETYPVCAVEKYIESGPVWEGWSWCDPRAYERYG